MWLEWRVDDSVLKFVRSRSLLVGGLAVMGGVAFPIVTFFPSKGARKKLVNNGVTVFAMMFFVLLGAEVAKIVLTWKAAKSALLVPHERHRFR
jgi:hypothetical protein